MGFLNELVQDASRYYQPPKIEPEPEKFIYDDLDDAFRLFTFVHGIQGYLMPGIVSYVDVPRFMIY